MSERENLAKLIAPRIAGLDLRNVERARAAAEDVADAVLFILSPTANRVKPPEGPEEARAALPALWQTADAIAQLKDALKECANRLERACRIVGNDDEVAAAAVARYRALLAGETK